MNRKKFLIFAIPSLLIALFSFSLSRGQLELASEKDQLLTQLIFHGLKAHYNAQNLDDAFSEKAFKNYLGILDPTKRFLTQADVDAMRAFEHKIDDEVNAGSVQLLELARTTMARRVQEAKGYADAILAQPFDFDADETYEADPDKRAYAASDAELKEVWRKSLKYQALVRYHTSLQEQEAKKKAAAEKGEAYTPKSPAEVEAEVRKQLQRTYNDIFSALGKYDDDDRLAEYLNAMVGVYDPHTEYFPPEDKENFDISMSGKLEGIGAQLQQADGEIKVSNIVPGSASWKQKELKEGDVILKVAQGEDEPVDVSDMPLKDAVKMIRGKKGTEVRLTVRKSDGMVKVIPIIRDVVILEENYAKSALIEDPARSQRYGYIKLPSFYADFQQSGGRNSADDVKLELQKLKAKGMTGLVLDLRNNGGGSLADAVEMSGLFIKKGPIVQVTSSMGEAKVWEDDDARVEWDGPLVILVNKFSASASEILSAALQDYGRAVVVGSPTTFGKGTVQRFIDLDYFLKGQAQQFKPMGSLKLTIQKFYRITGHSTQWKGVEPDIVLPDSYSFFEGEKDMDYALPWDEIKKVDYDVWATALPLKYVAKQSRKRTAKHEAFGLMAENADRLQRLRDKTLQPLHYRAYAAEQERLREEGMRFEGIRVHNDPWRVAVMPSNVDNEAMKEERQALSDAWMKEIKEDAVLEEATFIVDDLLSKAGS
jgi:carboxyl-terminal processing protease